MLTRFCSTPHPETATTATPLQAFPTAASAVAKGKQKEDNNNTDDDMGDDDNMDDDDDDDNDDGDNDDDDDGDDGDDGDDDGPAAAADDSAEKPCPWKGCAGTSKSEVFESNRLKYIPSVTLLLALR